MSPPARWKPVFMAVCEACTLLVVSMVCALPEDTRGWKFVEIEDILAVVKDRQGTLDALNEAMGPDDEVAA